MKHCISIFMATVLLLLLLAMPVRAADAYSLIGDADGDGEVTILDATRIQRSLASLDTMTVLQSYLADADGKNGVNIIDATVIQRRLADLGNGFWSKRLDHWNAHIDSVATVDSYGISLSAGTVQTFCINEASHPIPSEYEIYVDGLLVRERSIDAVFTYTFPASGCYSFSVAAYDPFGGSDVYRFEIAIQPTVQPLEITYTGYNRNSTILSVIASGGTAPYEYQYIIRNDIAGPPPGGNYGTSLKDFRFDTDENGQYILICEFCEKSAVYIPIDHLTKTLTYTCEVQARDASGALSEIKKVKINL